MNVCRPNGFLRVIPILVFIFLFPRKIEVSQEGINFFLNSIRRILFFLSIRILFLSPILLSRFVAIWKRIRILERQREKFCVGILPRMVLLKKRLSLILWDWFANHHKKSWIDKRVKRTGKTLMSLRMFLVFPVVCFFISDRLFYRQATTVNYLIPLIIFIKKMWILLIACGREDGKAWCCLG